MAKQAVELGRAASVPGLEAASLADFEVIRRIGVVPRAEDDALIGVKSTARLFGDNSARWLRRFIVATVLLTALAVKLDSRGPVFFRQKRYGFNNELIEVYKFRSMYTEMTDHNATKLATKDDPRITRVGRIIRKLRIDELPQTWTVLKGAMSFVGPRPERPEFVSDLEQHLPYYAERHMVKPGITGWAQINYPYGASIEDARHKLEYDLYYAKNYSPFLDLLILLQTLRVVIWHEGAR
jgi:lipopolysaccharide/colanic/teichoic acid biosynthesis glycosyltransferase